MIRPAPLWTFPLLALALGACTQFPELEHTRSAALDNAAYPALVPIDPILANIDAPVTDPVAAETELNARLAGLRARAEKLRRGGLTPEERRRLEEGLR